MVRRQVQAAGPRLRGIHEQYARARHFLQLARRCKKPASQYAYLVAAVYPARAIVELMLTAAERQQLPAFHDADGLKSRKTVEEWIRPRLAYCSLIAKVRIHDFHRSGLVPSDPRCDRMFIEGPVKPGVTRKGEAVALSPTESGLKDVAISTYVQRQRPLVTRNGSIWDDETSEYVSLGKAVTEYLGDVPSVIADFERLLRGEQP